MTLRRSLSKGQNECKNRLVHMYVHTCTTIHIVSGAQSTTISNVRLRQDTSKVPVANFDDTRRYLVPPAHSSTPQNPNGFSGLAGEQGIPACTRE